MFLELGPENDLKHVSFVNEEANGSGPHILGELHGH